MTFSHEGNSLFESDKSPTYCQNTYGGAFGDRSLGAGGGIACVFALLFTFLFAYLSYLLFTVFVEIFFVFFFTGL